MSMWWDDEQQRYRSSLPYKVFYVWGWPFSRWVLHNCMTAEQAHWFAIHIAIPWVARLDRAWSFLATIGAVLIIVPLILVCRLLVFLPWFSWEPDGNTNRGDP